MTTLACLDDRPAPPELGPALAGLARWSADQQALLPELVPPCLDPLPEDQLEARIGRFCRRHELPADLAPPALKAIRFLLRACAAMNGEPEMIRRDVEALLGSDELAALLVPIYVEVLPALRQEILQATIAGHGRVLVGLEWRIDTIGSSNRGRGINAPVAQMTFHVQQGGQAESVTIQMLPDMVRQLRDTCDLMLKK